MVCAHPLSRGITSFVDFSSEPPPTSDGSEPLSTLSVFSTLLHARAARLSPALWLHSDVHIARRTHCTFHSSCSGAPSEKKQVVGQQRVLVDLTSLRSFIVSWQWRRAPLEVELLFCSTRLGLHGAITAPSSALMGLRASSKSLTARTRARLAALWPRRCHRRWFRAPAARALR